MNFAPASRLLGQFDFADVGSNIVSDYSLGNYIDGISAGGNRLVVADTQRNRVMIWNIAPNVDNQIADIVLGQPNLTSTSAGLSASGLNLPDAVWTDGTKLIVADGNNNRVLIWKTFPIANQQAADLVLGQQTFGTGDKPETPTATSMYFPQAVYSDGTRLYVADTANVRVLIWNSFPTSNGQAPDIVIGQKDFTSAVPGTDTGSLRGPTGIVTAADNLFVVDQGNNRVLIYSPIPSSFGATASQVLGQTDFLSNVEATSQTGLMVPTQIAVQGNKAYVTDSFNSRILRFSLNL